MKTRIIWYTFFLIIGFQNLHGQKTGLNYIQNLTDYQPNLTGELFKPDLPLDEITYFNSEWLAADIYLSNGEIAKNKLIKYNGLLDELFWLEPNSKNIIKLDKEAILQFHFQNLNDDSTVVFRNIRIKKNAVSDSSDVFGQVMYEGRLSLFIQHTYKFAGTELYRKNGFLLENNVYAIIPVYIFRFTNDKTFLTKSLNRKSLYSIFPEKRHQIKNFFRQIRQSKIESYNDSNTLMKFLNSIVFQ
jgi:hypothetical protein